MYIEKLIFQSWNYSSLLNALNNLKLTSICGTSLVVQWLRPGAPNAGDVGSLPVQGTRFRMPELKEPHATTKDPAQGNEDPACRN